MVADFLQRLSAYPVVNSAWQQASNVYGRAKAASPAYVRSAADRTETGLAQAVQSAGPLLSRLEPLDQLACRQLLDRLEARCPAVKSPTDQLAEATREYYDARVRPRVDAVLWPVSSAVAKAQSAKAYGLSQYRRLSGSSEELAAWLDHCVDHYLPEERARQQQQLQQEEAEEEQKDKAEETPPGFQRVGCKLARRLRRLAAIEAAAARDEFAARVAAAEEAECGCSDENVEGEGEGEGEWEAATSNVSQRLHAVSRASIAFAAARLPSLESMPGAARLTDWLSGYSRDQLQFDLFALENHLRQLAESAADDPEAAAAAANDKRDCNGGCGQSG